jgi:hypothetical protein
MTHLNLEQTQSIEAENLSPTREAQRPGGQQRDHDGEQDGEQRGKHLH